MHCYRTHYLISVAFVIALLIACNKRVEEPVIEPITEPEFVHYIIAAGSQFANINPYTPVTYSELKFVVKFDSSAIYTTQTRNNQLDINKLYGFADNNGHHNLYSARFGWRWYNNELHLFTYTYNNGVRSSSDLGKIDIGKEHQCSIKVVESSYIFTLNGKATSTLRQSTAAAAVGYKLYPYFGGDEVAPHTINIWVKELK